jgi:hypothetical protein
MRCLSRVGLALASLSLLVSTGCAMAASPVNGFFYSDVDAPLAVNSDADNTKKGMASCHSYLGICATGDASIETAAKNGGIKKIHHVDFKSHSVLGIYAEFTTIVYGE